MIKFPTRIVSVTAFYIVYLLFGAYVFKMLEEPNEVNFFDKNYLKHIGAHFKYFMITQIHKQH